MPASFRTIIEAFGTGDPDAMRPLLAETMVSYVTNAEGGADRVDGRDAYMARLPDVTGATYTTTVTQIVEVAPSQILAMVEIKAERKSRTLHNHAAFLAHFDADGRVDELWMVDALPEYSDEFWS